MTTVDNFRKYRPFSHHREASDILLGLRLSGFSTNSIAAIFNCTRPAIYSFLKKYGFHSHSRGAINPLISNQLILENHLKTPLWEADKWAVIDGEKINKGRSYQDYLDAAQHKRK